MENDDIIVEMTRQYYTGEIIAHIETRRYTLPISNYQDW